MRGRSGATCTAVRRTVALCIVTVITLDVRNEIPRAAASVRPA